MKVIPTFIESSLERLSLVEKTCAVHYSYDIHGNVKTLLQDNPNLSTITPSQQYKKTDYEYDLVSGNVNQVKYQDGQVDALYHKYEYDADNRITNVWTSKDNVIWEQDAKYFYYDHGPLARTELADNKAQAMDYAYTIQGWIKGVNSNNLKAENDIGQDGQESTSNLHKHIGRDAFGYSLNYFNEDYTAIDPNKNLTASNFIASVTAAAYLQTNAPDLFNGNISSMVTTIVDPSTNNALPQLTAYKYDQLNRIKQMKAYRDINLTANAWGDGSTYNGSYEEHYTYNANGSILNLSRNGLASIAGGNMDNLTYTYETVANGYTRNTNKLRQIQDAVGSSTYNDDMDSQAQNNYGYDEIGNLIKDDFECIQNIEWTVYGKVKKLTRTPSCTTEGTAMPDLEFNYNASGNLTEKIVKPASTLADANTWIHTYYVHNASGNIMATYEKEGSTFKLAEQQLYGSSHIGTAKRDLDLSTVASADVFSRTLGKKQFLLGDHRSNNNVTILDRKKPVESVITAGTIAYFEPVVSRAVDFFPGGREMNGRIWNKDESEFGYNGKPNIKEWSARLGGAINYGFRIYMPSCNCFISVDPLTKSYPMLTPYQFASNNPVLMVDLDGLEGLVVTINQWYENGTLIQMESTQFTNNDDDARIQTIIHNVDLGTTEEIWTNPIVINSKPSKASEQLAGKSEPAGVSNKSMSVPEMISKPFSLLVPSPGDASKGTGMEGEAGLKSYSNGINNTGLLLTATPAAPIGVFLMTGSDLIDTGLDFKNKGATVGVVNAAVRAATFGFGKTIAGPALDKLGANKFIQLGAEAAMEKAENIITDKVSDVLTDD